MPFIESAVKDAKEQETVPEGAYDLRIFSAEIQDSKSSGKPMVVVGIAIETSEHPNAKPITFYLPLTHGEDEVRSREFKLLQQARFLHTFEIPSEENGFNTDDFNGATASGVKLTVRTIEEDKDGNKLAEPFTVNDIQLKRLPREDVEHAAAVDTSMARHGGAKRRR